MTLRDRNEPYLLAEIGVSEQQELAYRLLLARGSLSAHELCEAQHLPPADAARLLDELQDLGLAICIPGSVALFTPGNPEVAIGALVLRRQATLDRTRAAIALLKREGERRRIATHDVGTELLEVIRGPDALQHGCERVLRSVRRELCALLPRVAFAPESGMQQASALAPQVHVRSVFDTMGSWSGRDEVPGSDGPRDEQRFAPSLPFGLLLADHQLALLVIEHEAPHQAVLLVRPCALLAGLTVNFELIWAEARSAGTTQDLRRAPDDASRDLDELLPLLAAGLNDKAIAHRLRISSRTLIRRVAKLLSAFQARSRFQAGWTAALRLHGISAVRAVRKSSRPAHARAGQQRDAGSLGAPRNLL